MNRITAAILLLLLPTAASAHVGIGGSDGFAHGFMHPIGAIDHILAMVAVGLFAAHLGARAVWLVPLTFVSVMTLAGALGMASVNVPFVESKSRTASSSPRRRTSQCRPDTEASMS